MKFQPKTDKELAEMNLWQPGNYSFEIIEQANLGQDFIRTEDRISKSGNDMIQLVLIVHNDNGGFRIMRDYLMEAMPHKLKHASETCGLLDKYETGELSAHEFVGKSGTLELKIEKDKSGQYPDKNAVRDYIVNNDTDITPLPAKDSADIDDEIPF